MKKIASFTINHEILKEGMYISRVDGDIVTYDLRTRKPNTGDVMENAAIHSFEHLFATVMRNGGLSEKVIYFGPMGCRTGFYLLMRDTSHGEALAAVKQCLELVVRWEGELPGSTAIECGNFREHDVKRAKEDAEVFLRVLEDWSADKMTYPS